MEHLVRGWTGRAMSDELQPGDEIIGTLAHCARCDIETLHSENRCQVCSHTTGETSTRRGVAHLPKVTLGLACAGLLGTLVLSVVAVSLSSKIDRVESKLSKLADGCDDLDSDIRRLKGELDSHDSRINDIESKLKL